jgi:hypothetical protein
MDFPRVLALVDDFLSARGYRHAVCGGIGLAAYGQARATLDIDFVVESGAQDELIHFLEQQGYETTHCSAGYSNHVHADPELGGVDFVYVREETRDRLFAAVRHVTGPGGLPMDVPAPEHLAAMKVLAMKSDPARSFQEMADIRGLLLVPGVDREAIRAAFVRHGLAARYDELLATL